METLGITATDEPTQVAVENPGDGITVVETAAGGRFVFDWSTGAVTAYCDAAEAPVTYNRQPLDLELAEPVDMRLGRPLTYLARAEGRRVRCHGGPVTAVRRVTF